MSDQIRTITNATFGRLVLEGSGPIAVEFMSYGCGFCRAIEPILQQVARKLHSKQTFYRVNVPVDHTLAETYVIEATPTFVMFRNGVEVGRAEGPDPTPESITAIVTQPFSV
jgi:thioredoxin 1